MSSSPMISGNLTGAAAYSAIQGAFSPGEANAASSGAPSSGVFGADAAGGENSFGAALQGAIANLSKLGRDADQKSVQGMTGGGNLTDVVMAVSKAEMALQATVAVRDKVVSAYQDVMRMAV